MKPGTGRLGLADAVKLGRWVPASVQPPDELSGPHTLEVLARDPDGNRVVYRSETAMLPVRQPLRVLVRIADPGSRPTARLLSGDGSDTATDPVWSSPLEFTTTPQRLDIQFVGHIGEVERDLFTATEEQRLFDLTSSAKDLRDPVELDAFDAIVVSAPEAVSPASSEVLKNWVRRGGHLLVFLRDEAAWEASPLASWHPIAIEQSVRVRELASLESFSRRSSRIPQRTTEAYTLTVPETGGVTLADSLEGPLLIRSTYGLGLLTSLGVDPLKPPLSDWTEREYFIAQMLSVLPQNYRDDLDTRGSRLSSTGITDLGTQLAVVEEEFAGVSRLSFNQVLIVAILYLLLIGPIDYLVVHRLLKRPGLTWITLPCWIVLGIVGTTLLTSEPAGTGSAVAAEDRSTDADAKPARTDVLVNRLDVVDIDMTAPEGATSTVRSQSWLSLYSEAADRYDIAAETPLPSTLDPQPLRLGWLAVAEDGFGGLYRPSALRLGDVRYTSTGNSQILTDVPIDTRSTKTLWGETLTTPTRSVVDAELVSPGIGQLRGRLSHSLPQALEDWIIAYEGRVYRPRTAQRADQKGESNAGLLGPGDFWTFEPALTYSRDLKGFLTGTRSVVDNSKQVGGRSEIHTETLPYDPQNRSVTDVLRMMSFHEVTGGASYTGLSHHLLPNWELSPALGLDRAILIGRLSVGSGDPIDSAFAIDGEPVSLARHEVYVRIILPVRKEGEVVRRLPKFD